MANIPIAKPFVKWAGGKTQLLNEIRAHYPATLGVGIYRYVEPFVGGGAVLFDILNNFALEEVVICDINYALTTTYLVIRNNLETLLERLLHLQNDYHYTTDTCRKEIYYLHREQFNSIKNKPDCAVDVAALFIFLNKTCFNGLYRENSKGAFNVPQGNYKNPVILDEINLTSVSKALQNVRVLCGDYQLTDPFIDSNTFCYFDPPYRPLTKTSNFNSYTKVGFCDSSQIRLAEFVDILTDRGASIVVSNSDPKNTDSTDSFFDDIYSRHSIKRVSAGRAINSVASRRGNVSELLIVGRNNQYAKVA